MDSGQRFLVRGTLGSGAVSVVYRAFDRVRGHDVALKVLRSAAPWDLARFKREFRCFADLAHPNVVHLHELHHDERGWSIAMELVDGLPMTRYLRHVGALVPSAAPAGAPRRRWTTIEALLYQLADAVHALHRWGAVHRDLKPSNVLVEPGGRVVVLDFGLARHHDAGDDRRGLVVGTPSYMAPEQAANAPPAASADWYSVGVMLFEALTGRRPFAGSPLQVMADKQAHEAPPARLFAPGLPEHLDRLCTALLQRDPHRRMDSAELFAALGASPSAATLAARRPPAGERRGVPPLVFDGAPAAVLVHGPPGVGRSTALRRAAADAAARGARVLAGRADRRENIPCNALDAVIDAAAAAEHGAAAAGDDAGDGAGSALGRTLRRLARAAPVVVVIDDVHASDLASRAALAAALGAASGASWLLAVDDHDPATPAIAAGLRAARPDLVELELTPLDEDGALALWQREAGRWVTDEERRLVAACGGSPALVSAIASGPMARAGDLASWIAGRAGALSPAARALLRVVAASPRPVDAVLAATAAAVAQPAVTLAELRASRLVRTSHGGGRDLLAIADERLRAPLVADMAEDERRELHRTIASGLEALVTVDHQALLDHWLLAGHAARARRHAAFAASRAEDEAAHDRAAHYYAIALDDEELSPARRRYLAVRRASALACAGRAGAAADQYAAAAADADDEERLELLRLEVEQRLRAEPPGPGLARALDLLAAIGVRLPRTPPSALATRAALALRRAVPWPRRRPVTPASDRRMRVLTTVAAGMAFVDPIAGDAVQRRLWREVLASGAKAHLAQATALRLAYRAARGQRAGGEIERHSARGLALADDLDDPVLAGWLHAGSGVASYLGGDYRDARDRITRSQHVLRQRGDDVRWLLDIGDIYLTAALWMLGDGRALRRAVPALLRDAQARGDRLAERAIRGWRSNALWLLLDRPDDAHDHVEAAATPRAGAPFSATDLHELLSRAQIDLYRGHGDAAHRRVAERWSALATSSLRVVQSARLEAWFLRGRCALAAAATSRERRRLHGTALLAARRLASERTTTATAYAAALRATVALQRGDRAVALEQLTLAACGFGAAEMRLYAAAAHAHLAVLVGGTAGDQLAADAGAAMAGAAVVSPTALTAMLLPGW
jgi:hypothetical protein